MQPSQQGSFLWGDQNKGVAILCSDKHWTLLSIDLDQMCSVGKNIRMGSQVICLMSDGFEMVSTVSRNVACYCGSKPDNVNSVNYFALWVTVFEIIAIK